MARTKYSKSVHIPVTEEVYTKVNTIAEEEDRQKAQVGRRIFLVGAAVLGLITRDEEPGVYAMLDKQGVTLSEPERPSDMPAKVEPDDQPADQPEPDKSGTSKSRTSR